MNRIVQGLLLFVLTAVSFSASARNLEWTAPDVKIRAMEGPPFVAQLWDEFKLVTRKKSYKDVQVHMGYWSGGGMNGPNRGGLMHLLEAGSSGKTDIAVWDEGDAYTQLPSYMTMLDEAWYERITKPKLTWDVDKQKYDNKSPVSLAQADKIWGLYSQRYAEIAEQAFKASGKKVQVWCYVKGALPGRVFQKYELPILKALEKEGSVDVHFAKNAKADMTHAGDWLTGTANAAAGMAP